MNSDAQSICASINFQELLERFGHDNDQHINTELAREQITDLLIERLWEEYPNADGVIVDVLWQKPTEYRVDYNFDPFDPANMALERFVNKTIDTFTWPMDDTA